MDKQNGKVRVVLRFLKQYKTLYSLVQNCYDNNKQVSLEDDEDSDDDDKDENEDANEEENEKEDDKCITDDDIKNNKDIAILHHFNLIKSMKHNLNYVVSGLNLVDEQKRNVFIQHYNRYKDVFYTWFDQRRKYYVIRLTREIILCELYIKMYNNIIKFINTRNKYTLNDISKAEQVKILTKRDTYDIINKTVLLNPGYIKNEDLVERVLKEKADYDYLLTLNSLEINSAGLLSIRKKLHNKEKELEHLNKDNEEEDNANIQFFGEDHEDHNECEEEVTENRVFWRRT